MKNKPHIHKKGGVWCVSDGRWDVGLGYTIHHAWKNYQSQQANRREVNIWRGAELNMNKDGSFSLF